MSKINYTMLIMFLLYGFISCNTTEPPQQGEKGNITLSLADTSCTEAWVKLKTQNISTPAQISFRLNDSAFTNINLTTNDTVIYIDSLLPNKKYQLQAKYTNNNGTVKSNMISFQTKDTTSSNFVWSEFTFGNPAAASSELRDVAIINEQNVWAVGEINKTDTNQNGYSTYNAVHWDGTKWDLIKIPYIYNGTPIYSSIQCLFAFNNNDIWFSNSVQWDGQKFNNVNLAISIFYGVFINKIWGNPSGSIYVVGNSGTIAYSSNHGTYWTRIESGTNTNLNDIWAYYNKSNNNLSILTVASNILKQGEYRLLAVSGSAAHDTLNWPYQHWLKGVWFKGKYSPVYVCGSGVRRYENGKWEILNLPSYFTESIRGTGVNDIITAGDYGFAAHFNGIRWKVYNNLMGNKVFKSAAIKGNTVVLVGNNSSGGIVGKAVIIVGKR